MARSKKRRKIFIIAAIAAVLAMAGVAVVFLRPKSAIAVQSGEVSRHSLTNLVVADGLIEPVVQVTISPEVSGEIVDLPVHEGQQVTNGDLLVRINPDVYVAAVKQAQAGYESALASRSSAEADLEKAEADYKRNEELFKSKLLSESDFIGFRAARDVAKAQLESAGDQVEVAKALVDSAKEQLARTTIVSPITGTITRLNSEVGERVLGTVQNVGTEIMTISDLRQIEAQVNVGEMDVVKIKRGQKARLQLDAFNERKFSGVVTDVADSAGEASGRNGNNENSQSGQQQQSTQFQVLIRFRDKDPQFRPGMTVTAQIETEYRTNVLTVPLACVTTRPMRPAASATPDPAGKTNGPPAHAAPAHAAPPKPTDVVFVVQGDRVKAAPVKIGICDDTYWEITGGLTNGEKIITGGYLAVDRDLQDGSKIKATPAGAAPAAKP